MSTPVVVLKAPFGTQSGYGVHARQLGKWLLGLHDAKRIVLQCVPLGWGNTPWILSGNALVERLYSLSSTRSLSVKPDFSFQLQLPNEWDHKLASTNIGVTAAVETTVAPKEWVDCCARMDHVVLPSKHAADSLLAAGASGNNFTIIPESFEEELVSSEPDYSSIGELKKFTFLVFGQITSDLPSCDRKNLRNTILWLCTQFAGDPDVGIVLKSNVGRNTTFDEYKTTVLLKQILEEARTKTKKEMPSVKLVHGQVPLRSLAALYKHPNVKALVSATHGEGFGLPILEAAACDLPVIATGWSAHTEFLSLGKYIDLPYKLAVIPTERVDRNIFVQNSKWANVSEQEFKKRVEKFRNSSVVPKQWALDLGQRVRKEYSEDVIEKRYNDFIKEK